MQQFSKDVAEINEFKRTMSFFPGALKETIGKVLSLPGKGLFKAYEILSRIKKRLKNN